MVTQKYSSIAHSLPRSFALLVVGSMIGGAIEWYAEWSIPQLIIPLVALLSACIASVWVVKMRRWCFVGASLAIGISACARLVQSLPPPSSGASPMKGWLIGTVDEVLAIHENRFRCLVRATVDPKYLPRWHGVRALLSGELPTARACLKRGDRIVATVLVHLPECTGLPATISEWQFAASRGIQIIAHAVRGTVAVLPPTTTQRSLVEVVRDRARQLSDSVFVNPVTRFLSNALVLGQREELDRDTRQLFSKTGTAHLLSVSGFHVGVIATIIFLLTAAFTNRVLRLIVTVGGIWFYILLTGASPPAVRAGVATSIALGVLYLQRWIQPLHGVVLGIWIMLLIEPRLVLSVSFQLSAAAVIGIITVGSKLRELPIWRVSPSTLVKYLKESVAITIGAAVASAPLTAYYFGYVPIMTLLANIIVVPLASLFIIASAVSIVMGHFVTGLGRFYASMADFSADIMLRVLQMLASFDWNISGPAVTVLSVTASFAFFYIVSSRSIRHGIFRFSSSAFLVLSVWAIERNSSQLPLQKNFVYHGMHATVQRVSSGTILVELTVSHTARLERWFLERLYQYCMENNPERIYIRAHGIERSMVKKHFEQSSNIRPHIIYLQ